MAIALSLCKRRLVDFVICATTDATPPRCRRLGVERVVIVGVQTPNCIRATAYDAISLDFRQVSWRACHLSGLGCGLRRSTEGEHEKGILLTTELQPCDSGLTPNVQVTVLEDATASRTESVQRANFEDFRNVGIDTPSVAEWAAQVGK